MGRPLWLVGFAQTSDASLDQSLRRLRLDYVDLFYCHRYDPSTPLEETLQALVDIVRAGKALYVGLSRWPLEAMLKGYDYLKQHDVPCLIYQGRFNLFDQAPKAEGILDAIAQNQTGFISFSPLAQGLLTNRYLNGIPSDSRMAHDPRYLHADMLTPQVLNKIKQLNELAVMRGETLSTMALSWILHHPGITSVLVGASSPAQLRQNLSALQSPKFSDEEQQTISNILSTNTSPAIV